MATTSEVEICNMSLEELGVDTITSLTDDTSKRAQTCNRHYEATRDELLKMHDWHWARKRVALNRLVATPLNDYSWQFQLPTDFLRVVKAYPEGCPYNIVGTLLESNEPSVNLLYVWRVTDPLTFDPLFVSALAYRLAWKMAMTLTGSRERASDMLQKYSDALGISTNRDSSSDTPDEYVSDNLQAVRW